MSRLYQYFYPKLVEFVTTFTAKFKVEVLQNCVYLNKKTAKEHVTITIIWLRLKYKNRLFQKCVTAFILDIVL
jgi:virulence-associated protein VapD